MGKEAWYVAVHRVTKSWTKLSDWIELNGLVVFPTFFNLSLNLAIRSSCWATVSSQSCFFWLYRTSLSLAAKNIASLILVLTVLWCPCVESSLVLLEEGVWYDQSVFLAKLYYPVPCFLLYSKATFTCYSRYFLTSYFCILVPQWKESSEQGSTMT